MTESPFMPKATAVWLVENTTLTFKQIAEFCNLHELEIKGIADGDVAKGIKAYNPILAGQLSREEIEKCSKNPEQKLRLIKKIDEDFPTEIVLVLDGNIGQNSVKQAEVFKEICDIDSIIITKLDGTAKGGIVFPLFKELNIPVKFIGVGEDLDDLIVFNRNEYVQGLLGTGED